MNAPVTIHAMLREVTVRLETWAEAEERRCNVRRPPDFQLLYDPAVNWRPYRPVLEQQALDAHRWRRLMVRAFAISMFGTIAAVAFTAFIFLPL